MLKSNTQNNLTLCKPRHWPNVKQIKEIKFIGIRVTLKPSLVFNWVMLLRGFSVPFKEEVQTVYSAAF